MATEKEINIRKHLPWLLLICYFPVANTIRTARVRDA
jgi:hypothetical protein